MDQAQQRRQRLTQLLDLAQTYKGWTRKDLAKRLGRDPTKLVPGSGVPKLDLVIDLAAVLDWPVADVVELLWSQDEETMAVPSVNGQTFEQLNESARSAHRDGRYAELVQLAQQMMQAAQTPDERALACNREAGGWDGLGRYTNMLDAVQRGLQDGPLSHNRRALLEVNLANAHYSLWHLFEAQATSSNLIDRYEASPPTDRTTRVVQAFAHYAHGHSLRRMIDVDPTEAESFGRAAESDLQRAIGYFHELADEFEDDSYRGVANTCRGGLLEVAVTLKQREPISVLEELSEGLDAVIDSSQWPVGDWLESYGWWCIFGCNIALRYLTDEKALQQHMAVFTNKAEEIADRIDSWEMRERVFTMEYARRQRFLEWTGLESEWTIDRDDVRTVTGTMGRFPNFRRTGWRILQTAKVIREG